MRLNWIGALFVLAGLASVSPARADFVWEFNAAGLPSTNFVIPGVGSTVGVQIYLKETNGGTILSTQKLFSAGVQVTFNSPSGVAAVLAPSSIQSNPAFDDFNPTTDRSTSATSAKLTEAVTNISNSVAPDSQNRILFGAFTFTGQSVGTVTITATRFNPAPDDRIITGAGTVLDALIPNGSAQINVLGTATPEPGSLLLASLAGLALAGGGARRRFRRPAAQIEV
jgi:hypothetical protein